MSRPRKAFRSMASSPRHAATSRANLTGLRRRVPGRAIQMGLAHGLYCLGCCWLLFVILFPIGVMNIVAMALITLLIFAEKSLPRGQRIGQGAALALVVYGIVVIAIPAALPTLVVGTMPDSSMP